MLLSRIFLFLISVGHYCSGGRVKRVLHGTRVLGRKGPYDAVRYLVGFGSVHGVPFYTLGFHNSLKQLGIYGSINCGGSLLTPAIVQTACHCLATFDLLFFPRRTRINNHWESVRVVYIGINDRFGEPFSMVTRPPVKSIKFFVHKLCEKLQKGTQEATSHDFGIIKIDPGWISGKIRVPTTNVQFAPIYKTEELSKIFSLFLRTRPVCLNLGYGIFDEEGRSSDFIRAGWTTLMSDYLCREFTCVNLTRGEVSKYKSWVCAEEFPNHYQPAYSGDSGSPFTCNNAYFGLISGSLKQESGSMQRRFGTYSAFVFSAYENAFEHRLAFEEEIRKYPADSYVDIVRKIFQGFIGVRMLETKLKPAPTLKLLPDGTAHVSPSSAIQVPAGLLILLVALPCA